MILKKSNVFKYVRHPSDPNNAVHHGAEESAYEAISGDHRAAGCHAQPTCENASFLDSGFPLG